MAKVISGRNIIQLRRLIQEYGEARADMERTWDTPEKAGEISMAFRTALDDLNDFINEHSPQGQRVTGPLKIYS